jgi:hypothetical protein
VVRLEADGRRTPVATGITEPRWLAVAADETVYISARRLARDRDREAAGTSARGDVIVRLSPAGELSVFARGLTRLQGLAVDDEAVFAATRGRGDDDDDEGVVLRIPVLPDGAAGRAQAYGPREQFEDPRGLALDQLGALYLTTEELELGDDESEDAIAKLHGDGVVTRFAARLEDPQGLAFDAAGHLYVADGKAGRVLKFRAPPAPALQAPTATRQSPVTIHGTAERGARVDLFINEAAAPVSIVADRAGAFAAFLTLAANAENHLEVYATARGGRGLTSAPALATVTHDAIAPSLVFQTPPAGSHRRPPVAVRVQAADPGSGVATLALRVDGQPLAAALSPAPPAASITASAALNASGVADGAHTLAAAASDQAGNTGAFTRVVIVDSTPPETVITAGPEATTSATSVTLAVTGTDNLTPREHLVFAWRLDAGLPYSAFGAETHIELSGLRPGPHAFEVVARDLAGNEDPTPAARTFTVGSLQVTITDPADAATVPGGLLLVRGAVDAGGAEVGVSINGVPAAIQGTTFAVLVSVAPDTTTLTAVATTPAGATSSHRVFIVVSEMTGAEPVLAASPRAGVAPLAVRFSLLASPVPIKVELDADGDGAVDVTGPSLDDQSFTYAQPGLYVSSARLTDAAGTTRVATAVIQVWDRAGLDAQLQAKWQGMKSALRQGDIDGALTFIALAKRASYRRMLVALGAQVTTIDQILTDVSFVEQTGARAEYQMIRIDSGVRISHFILFVRDEDGIWRLRFF